MIKIETLGMLDVAKINPVLTSLTDTPMYKFMTVDGVTYLIANTLTGDDAYQEGIVIPAGDYLNGFDIAPWVDQKLVADEKHIDYASEKDYDDIVAGTTLMKINASGNLEVIAEAPGSGFYFKVTDKCRLTEKAIKIKLMVA
jgi:hypothetical protein